MTTTSFETSPQWKLFHSLHFTIAMGAQYHESSTVAAVINDVTDEERAQAADLVDRYTALVAEAEALKEKHKPAGFTRV